MNYLADFMISGEWLIAAGVALIPVLGGVWLKAKKAGLNEATNNITIQSPVPEVTTRQAPDFAHARALAAHENRSTEQFKGIANDVDQIHARINSAFRKLDTLDGTVTAVEGIVGRLLDIQLNLPAGSTAANSRKKRTSTP